MFIINNIKLRETTLNDGATENQMSCIGWFIIYHAAEVSGYIWPNLIQCWIVPRNSQKNTLISVLQHF